MDTIKSSTPVTLGIVVLLITAAVTWGMKTAEIDALRQDIQEIKVEISALRECIK